MPGCKISELHIGAHFKNPALKTENLSLNKSVVLIKCLVARRTIFCFGGMGSLMTSEHSLLSTPCENFRPLQNSFGPCRPKVAKEAQNEFPEPRPCQPRKFKKELNSSILTRFRPVFGLFWELPNPVVSDLVACNFYTAGAIKRALCNQKRPGSCHRARFLSQGCWFPLRTHHAKM